LTGSKSTKKDVQRTPKETALHYIWWHTAAYMAPAPLDELQYQLHKRHGMESEDAVKLLDEMLKEKEIEWVECTYISSGYALKETDPKFVE